MLAPHLVRAAWDECIESQGMDKEAWVARTLNLHQAHTRYEIYLYEADAIVGGLTLTVDDDPHVGECLSVLSQYVLPEYRNRGVSGRCLRECLRIAKDCGAKYLAYTHRKKDWVYTTTYRRIV
jgi:GNAT superfamily N-acetyltransferase